MVVSSLDLSPNRAAGATVSESGHGPSGRNASAAHVLMIPYPSQSHILPMLDLANQLARSGGITVTFVCFQVFIDRLLEGESKRGSNLSDALCLIGVPDDRPNFNPPNEFEMNPRVLRESLQLGYNMEPFLERLLQDQGSIEGFQAPTCLVVDVIHWWSTDVASRLGIPRYVLGVFPGCFFLALLSSHANGVDEGGGIHLPGLPHLIRSSKHFSPGTKGFVTGEQVRGLWPKCALESDGVLLNTCLALERHAVNSFRTLLPENIPLMTVGPLGMFPSNVSMEGLELSDEVGVMNWLNQQPPSSVLYVSFGTTGLNRLTKRHVLELARGLESSQNRFVWVLRAPPDVRDVAETLPHGFQERVKERGQLLTGWAPQKQILTHPSTGGFLTSCGWNSVVESLIRGVPIIGWPSFADQPTGCRYIEVMLKVAIELPRQEDDFVEAEEIKEAIRVVLQSEEGRAMRERAGKYKTSIREDLRPGGSSRRAVEDFAELIRHQSAGRPTCT